MPKLGVNRDVCAVCGHPAAHRLRIVVDDKALRNWYLCPRHAEVIATRDYAIQLEPEYGGKWLWANEPLERENTPLG